MIYGVILAGGNSSRFNGTTHKSLYKIWEKEIIKYNIDEMSTVVDEIIIVVKEKYLKDFKRVYSNCKYVIQEDSLGTADALKYAMSIINQDGDVIVMNADTFMLKPYLGELYKYHKENKYAATVLGIDSVVNASALVEKNDNFYIDESIKEYTLKNSGIYIFDKKVVEKNIDKIDKVNGEYYITKIFDFIDNKGIYKCYDNELISINTQDELKELEEKFKR